MNITGIDLNLLIAFESLLDERHVGRAAKRVGLSQPAFSNAIGRLRVRLDDPLFVRTSRGMLPTPRAEHLGVPIRLALSLLRQTLEAPRVFDPNASAQRFRIGLSDDVELRLVGTVWTHNALWSFAASDSPPGRHLSITRSRSSEWRHRARLERKIQAHRLAYFDANVLLLAHFKVGRRNR